MKDFTKVWAYADEMAQAAVDKVLADGTWCWFPCGFQWLKSKGNTAFGKWALANDLARKSDYSGLFLNCAPKLEGPRVQSRELQTVYMREFAKVLDMNGIKGVVSEGRDD